MTVQHRDLADGRWTTLSLAEQLGNIGSEVSRAIAWKPKNAGMSERAAYRALELFDLTLTDPRLLASPARLREIARAREVTADFLVGPNQYRSTAVSLQKYFDAYALAARRRVMRA
ncbi:MAG TPA: hypothetical protein VG538_02765 [Vicinamibacterales bacterium]|jgi:hypothetical protein|nr:hypothetical protein [Vicinamibacterales bacterium]